MKSKNSAYTFEEVLALRTEELLSNWTKFTSLIRPYEGISWHQAGAKARALIASGEGAAYIETVREDIRKHPERLKEPPKQPDLKKESNELTIYERNYILLMEIAPELEERLINFKGDGSYIYGKSQLTGTRDFNIDFVRKDKVNFFLALSQYSLVNGDLVGDPDMEIRVNLKDRMIEALHYQDQFRYVEVYTDKTERKAVYQGERKRQNAVLGEWLKKLKKQGHKVVFQDTDDNEPEFSSEIIDLYKKEEKEVKKPEKPKRESGDKTADKPDEIETRQEEAKIVSLPTDKLELRGQGLDKFLSIVTFLEAGTPVPTDFDLNERVDHILKRQGLLYYLSNAWEKLHKESGKRLNELNFYRLIFLAPGVSELLNNSGENMRLVSEKSTDAFSIELGDDRKKTAKILAVYQLNGRDDQPTLLLKVNEVNHTLTVDLTFNGFMNMETFDISDENLAEFDSYRASIGVENWLKFLKANEYRAIPVNLKPVQEEKTEEPEPVGQDQSEDPDEFDNDYINKDIPDFEPGHIELTETHKKHHVTQKMIDRVNETQKGITVFPRTKKMVYNTKSNKSDKNKQAMQPGFRMSKTGKLYYEGRSNRADRDQNSGL